MDRSAHHHSHLPLESVPLERREPSIDSAPVRALQKADCTSKFRLFEYPCHFELSTKHGINGKTKITCHGNVHYILLRGSLVWQVRSKSPHLPALSPAESHRRQVRMAGDFRVRLAGGSLSEKYIISQFHPFQSIAGGQLSRNPASET